jgi:beta-xylosidase
VHSLAWRSRSQANKPHAVQYCVVTTTHGETDTGFPKLVQQSQDDLTVLISEQGLHAQASSASRITKILPLKFSTGFPFRECAHGFSQRQTQTPQLWTGVYTDSSGQHRLSFLYQNYTRVSYRLASLDSPQDSRIEWMRNPPFTAYFVCFICML